ATQRVPHHPAKKYTPGEQRGRLQIELVVMEKEHRYPGEIKPEGPTVTKIHRGNGKHSQGQAGPRHWIVLPLFSQCVSRQDFELLGRDAAMLRGIVSEIPEPHHCPHQTYDPQDHERAPPGYQCNQPSNQRWRNRVAESRTGMCDALGEPALSFRRPVRHSSGCSRKGGALAKP